MHRRILFVVSLVCVAALAAAAPPKANTTTTKASTPVYATLSNAVTAASSAPQLTTLLAAVRAAGVASALKADTTWTILAPNNAAFEKRLAKLNVTADALLKNKELLVKILSYHVIPSGAVLSTQLKDNETVATALKGATPLEVVIYEGSVYFKGPVNKAKVIVADIKAGSSVIHVIDDVLVPPSIVSEAADKKTAGAYSAQAAAVKKVTKP